MDSYTSPGGLTAQAAHSANNANWIRAVALGLGLALALTACRSTLPVLDVVDEVDLDRYAGQWYEIASFPQRFQRGCVASQAHYTPMEDGRIRVENACPSSAGSMGAGSDGVPRSGKSCP